jgi:hypothetical protein
MKPKDEKKQRTLEKDYEKIMKDFKKQDNSFSQVTQWTNPGDFIVKFSLYQETPNSITSTDTSVNIGI